MEELRIWLRKSAMPELTDIHSDAADMHDLQNMKLMGGHQIIAGIRPETDKPIECHIYTVSMGQNVHRTD